tara:strand:- start:3 stop:197 length:195 start_codon:yes stop_codon:yes gene_type:complete
MTWREINMPLDTGTNEWDGDEGEECDNFEPDYDKDNDDMWLRKKEEEEKQQQIIESCCQLGDIK